MNKRWGSISSTSKTNWWLDPMIKSYYQEETSQIETFFKKKKIQTNKLFVLVDRMDEDDSLVDKDSPIFSKPPKCSKPTPQQIN